MKKSQAAGAKGNGRSTRDVPHYSSFIQVFCPDVEGASATALLAFDTSRYFFNAGEGCQRHMRAHKLRIGKIDEYLFTRLHTSTMAGLPGMLLSRDANDAGGLLAGKQVVAHGLPGTRKYVNAFRQYIYEDLNVTVDDIGDASQPVVSSSYVSISPIILSPAPPSPPQPGAAAEGASLKRPLTADGDGPEDEGPSAVGDVAKRQKTHGDALPDALPAHNSAGRNGACTTAHGAPSTQQAVCYVCRLSDRPGKFLPSKAAALGVPPGPLYGQLSRGQAVMGANGRLVQPCEVMDPPQLPGPLLLVLDCPSERHVAALPPPAEVLSKYAPEDASAAPRLVLMLHLGPHSVVTSPAYMNYMTETAAAWQHVVVNAGQPQHPLLQRGARLQAQLNVLHPDIFPLGDLSPGGLPANVAASSCGLLPEPLVVGHNGLKYTLTPGHRRGPSHEECLPPVDAAAIQKDLREARPEVLATLAASLTEQEGQAEEVPGWWCDCDRNELSLTFLGTTSAVPQSFRNVSSTYVDFPGRGGLLVDCGEDSWGQMQRSFGAAGAASYLASLQAVWISHMHADHHGGLYPLLQRRTAALGQDAPALLVVGPWPLLKVLQAYLGAIPLSFLFLPNNHFVMRQRPDYRPPPAHILAAYERVVAALGLTTFEPFPVEHVNNSFGLRLEGAKGWKVVFSGDTRPCEATVAAAKGATLLVHEATFEDDMRGEAIAKRHSTTAEAVDVGMRAGAWRTILTHFSSRYPKMPALDLKAIGRVGVAFDFMRVNLKDLKMLPAFVKAQDLLLVAEKEEDGGEEA